ncbi:MAG: hypothetical protein IJU50_04690 [Lachnospiraceae bacterium]|nr:hypothetical protein [Lachnospiraceae bacterium]
MRIIYKCRLCGKTFSDTVCPERTARFVAENLCVSECVSIHGMNVMRHGIHVCEEGNPDRLGFADFIGAKKEGHDEEGVYVEQESV